MNISHRMMLHLIKQQIVSDRKAERERESAWLRIINLLTKRNNQKISRISRNSKRFMDKFVSKFRHTRRSMRKEKMLAEQQYKTNLAKANSQIQSALASFRSMATNALAKSPLSQTVTQVAKVDSKAQAQPLH